MFDGTQVRLLLPSPPTPLPFLPGRLFLVEFVSR
jgi:hypothetical protein